MSRLTSEIAAVPATPKFPQRPVTMHRSRSPRTFIGCQSSHRDGFPSQVVLKMSNRRRDSHTQPIGKSNAGYERQDSVALESRESLRFPKKGWATRISLPKSSRIEPMSQLSNSSSLLSCITAQHLDFSSHCP